MVRAAVEQYERISMRTPSSAKATLLRAAALKHTDLTEFVMAAALREAEAVIEQAETVAVSDRGFEQILELMDNPPPLNDRMKAALDAIARNK